MIERIYIDTHVLVWLHDGEAERITPKIANLIDKAERVIVPIMAMLELYYLYEIKRLKVHPEDFLNRINKLINALPDDDLNALNLIIYGQKNNWTRDPFDRLITAEASIFEAPLITKDKNILSNYKKATW